MRSRPLRVLAAVLAALAGLASAQPRHRLVLAHYMVTNQDFVGDDGHNEKAKIAAYQREIRQAQNLGIDGFALNVGGWLQQPYYIRYSAQIFEAALRLHSGFRLVFSADMCCGNGIADVEDMMRRFAGNPRYAGVYLQHDGRFVLTTFAGEKLGTAGWQQIRTDLEHGTHPSTAVEPAALAPVAASPANAPLRLFLVPAFFPGGERPSAAAIQHGLDPWRSTIDGSFYWGIAGVPGSGGALDQLHSSEAYAAAVHAAGKLYMAPVCLQFWGANANRYFEYSGASGMAAMWKNAIQTSHPDWVEIITWNDFIEGTYISPIDDPNRYPAANFLIATGIPAGTLGYFHTHAGADPLLAFYIRWYKTGVQPPIRHDALYLFYRTQSRNPDDRTPPVAHMFGPVANVVYITAQLTAPALLRVTSGSRSTLRFLPAGTTEVSAPFAPGSTPAVVLQRHGHRVLAGSGLDPIERHPAYNDFYDSTRAISAADRAPASR